MLQAIRTGRVVADGPLDRAVATLEQSLRWGATPSALSDLALLKLVRLRSREAFGLGAHQDLLEFLTTQEHSLARAPATTDGWARLTYGRYELSGLDQASRDALEMSFLTGRLERSPMAFRLQLMLREWPALDPEMRALARREIRQLTRHGPGGIDALVEVYRGLNLAGREVVQAVLAGSPQDQASFDRLLGR